MLRKHPKPHSDTTPDVSFVPLGSVADVSEVCDSSSHFHKAQILEGQLMQQSASFILKLKSVYGLSQNCIDDIIQQTKSITQTATAVTRKRLLGEIKQDASVKAALDEKVTDCDTLGTVDVFTGVESSWMQQKYFREQFGLIEPVEIKMGERTVVKHKFGKLERVPAFGYCVPFLSSLKQLLQIENVAACICGDGPLTASVEGVMLDFDDGYYCKTHGGFGSYPNIRILGYFDYAEVVNPIGVHTKKTQIEFYFIGQCSISHLV